MPSGRLDGEMCNHVRHKRIEQVVIYCDGYVRILCPACKAVTLRTNNYLSSLRDRASCPKCHCRIVIDRKKMTASELTRNNGRDRMESIPE